MENQSSPDDVREILHAQTLVYHHAFNVAGTMSIKCALELGIHDAIDHLGGGPVMWSQLTATIPAVKASKLPYLSRLMRLLVQLGFLTTANGEKEEEGYLLTPFSRILLTRNPLGLVKFYLGYLRSPFLAPWHCLSEWFTGDVANPFELKHGKTFWGFLEENPEMGHVFNEGMLSESRFIMDVVVHDCSDVFSGIGSLVDVGGGYGGAATAIAKAFPDVKCMVLDQPHVVDAIPEDGKSKYVDFVAGDMFQHVPSADALFLKNVLHDWNDEDCVKILKRCKEALPVHGGKLIVLEVILNCNSTDPTTKEAQLFFDMTMMVALAAKERDEEEWHKIFMEAGFTRFKITHAIGIRSLMEVWP
ncbi:class I SAM-dependent methyltransferase [Escherichia coli]|uniref:class I SAM-dependent methyltransferase n=1 Tax=Escherichia coli TaxID=562 RepID=UPI003B998073